MLLPLVGVICRLAEWALYVGGFIDRIVNLFIIYGGFWTTPTHEYCVRANGLRFSS